MEISRSTVLRVLMAFPIPSTPRVHSVDVSRCSAGCRYATMLIDAVTHQRVDMLPDRKAATLASGCASIPAPRSFAVTGRLPHPASPTESRNDVSRRSWSMVVSVCVRRPGGRGDVGRRK
jgi:hypothetical protein